MQVERPHYLGPEQKIHFTNFTDWIKKRGIRRFLFDLDDTICATRQIFVGHINQILDHLTAFYPFLTPKQWKDVFESTRSESYEKNGVNPDQYNVLTDNFCDKFNLNNKTRDTVKDIFKDIYNTPVTFVEGAEKTLEFLKKVHMPIGIVTHANPDWPFRKYYWLDLRRFLKPEAVYIVDQDGHKTSESWQGAIDYFHLQPQDCAVVGDSPRSDINPAIEIGVKHCFLVKNPTSWSVQQQPICSDIPQIDNIYQIIQIGAGQL